MCQSAHSAGIPYEEIDCEIRRLVKLINQLPGIRTEFSCVGHKEEEEAYVSFVADSQESLERLLSSLPYPLQRMSVVGNQFQWSMTWVDVGLNADGGVRYSLRVSGAPQYIQRQRLGEIEAALAMAVAGLSQ